MAVDIANDPPVAYAKLADGVQSLTAGQLLYGAADGRVAQATPASLGASLILVERQTLAAAAQAVTFSGLAGNTDQRYVIEWQLKTADTAPLTALTLTFNAGAGTYYYMLDYSGSHGSSSASGAGSPLTGWPTSTKPCVGTGRADIWAAAGAERVAYSVSHFIDSDGKRQYGRNLVNWLDTSTEVTAIVLTANAADVLLTGSIFSLYKVR